MTQQPVRIVTTWLRHDRDIRSREESGRQFGQPINGMSRLKRSWMRQRRDGDKQVWCTAREREREVPHNVDTLTHTLYYSQNDHNSKWRKTGHYVWRNTGPYGITAAVHLHICLKVLFKARPFRKSDLITSSQECHSFVTFEHWLIMRLHEMDGKCNTSSTCECKSR